MKPDLIGESKLRSKPNTVISKFAAAIALLMAITFFTTAQAQITTAIRGVVVNQQDEAVTDASVKITHTASGTVSLATSNENGVFSARGLRVGGPYSVEISGSGFSAVRIDDLYLALDRT
ncbi:carboxypeptidase-like regulatory domain-containing protein, partial [Pseudomonadales bacterium]|nr:carboxypeptidase-like regulatory domain-containing protein [Pseudomonadales bacterium]